MGDEGVGRLAEALTTNSTLTTLVLRGNEMGAAGAGRLAEALAINSTLANLNLGYNKFGAAGARRLAEALATNSSLTTLDLWANDFNKLINDVYINICRKTSHPFDAHLDRNKSNLKKKSASLFLLLLPSLSLVDDEPF